MQATWGYDVEWDSRLPPEILNEWNDYVNDVQKVGTIRVPRRVIQHEDPSRLYLHGFCDASEKAYGACLYIQSEDQESRRTASLLCSKSRVAAVKNISLPRLELCGAVLLKRLIQAVKKALNIEFEEVRAWTDSMIPIAWIAKESSDWQSFVANRVSEIQSSLPYSQWSHVSGKETPADFVSRGVSCDKLENNELWWTGLPWLQNGEITQQSVDEASQSEEIQEVIEAEAKRHKTISVNIVSRHKTKFFDDFIEKYPSISKMERLLSYCLRFIRNYRKQREERVVEGSKISEINSVTEFLLKHVQEISFPEEIKEVGGKIQELSVSFQQRHQILLPDKHRLTKLLVEREHLRLCHVGPQALLAAVRTRYWPLNGRNLVRRIYHECLVRYRANPTPASQIMGALPKTRVQPSRPFFITGVDFAGSIVILVNKEYKQVIYRFIQPGLTNQALKSGA